MNNNCIKSSSVAFDYAKCTKKLSGVLYEKEKKGGKFFCKFELAAHCKQIYISGRIISQYDYKKTLFTHKNFHW